MTQTPPALIPASDESTRRWQRLIEIAQRHPGLPVTLNQPVFAVGDALRIFIDAPTTGYLIVVTINSRDQATVLFPNRFHPDNRIEPGRLTLPTAEMQFDLTAGRPLGPALVIAFLSSKPLNLFQTGDPLIIGDQTVDVFRTLSNKGVAAMRDAPSANAVNFLAGLVETQVCKSHDQCPDEPVRK